MYLNICIQPKQNRTFLWLRQTNKIQSYRIIRCNRTDAFTNEKLYRILKIRTENLWQRTFHNRFVFLFYFDHDFSFIFLCRILWLLFLFYILLYNKEQIEDKVYYFIVEFVLPLFVDDESRNFFPSSRSALNESICVWILFNRNWYWTGSTARPSWGVKGISGWPAWVLDSMTAWCDGM